jgi:hypothetical protein
MSANANLRHIIMSIGLFLVGISLYCSFLLYTSFSPTLSDKAAWGGMGLGLDMFKNIALIAALALWTLGFFAARIISVLVFAAYGVLSVLSFMAFFGFMSSVQHKLETQSLLGSNQYASAKASLESAEHKMAELSRYADSSAVHAAQSQLEALRPRLEEMRQGMARYAESDCTPKRDRRGAPYTTLAAEWCAKLQAVQAEAQPWQAQIDGYRQYQSALAHRERMLAELAKLEPNSLDSNNGYIHPMFVDLGKLISAAPDEMKVIFMFVSSAAAEILGTLSVLIAYLLGRKRSFTLDEIELLSGQLREQQHRLHHALSNGGLLGHSPALAGYAGLAGAPLPSSPPEAPPPASRQEKPKLRRLIDKRPPLRISPQVVKDEGLPHSQAVLTEMTEAVLNGLCPPKAEELAARYYVNARIAQVCLETLAAEGYLLYQAELSCYVLNLQRVRDHTQEYSGKLMCGGIEHVLAGKPAKVYFPNPSATLPVRQRNGNIAWLSWGRRKHENGGNLPPGSSAPLHTVRAGEWAQFNPRPVLIPASAYMEQDHQGRRHWFPLAHNMMIQGLVASVENAQRLYIVTIETPHEIAPDSDGQPRPECWPRLFKQDANGAQPVFH